MNLSLWAVLRILEREVHNRGRDAENNTMANAEQYSVADAKNNMVAYAEKNMVSDVKIILQGWYSVGCQKLFLT